MLPLNLRLKNKKAFNCLFRRGKTISEGFMLMKYDFSKGYERKIGFSAGLNFSKKATERNRAKRWMREAVRSITEQIKPGYQIVFVINSKAAMKELDYGSVKKTIENMLKKAKII